MASNGSCCWNETDTDHIPGRLTVSPSKLVSDDQEFYWVVTSIILISGIAPNVYIIVQILR
jgi:hypothetical protein